MRGTAQRYDRELTKRDSQLQVRKINRPLSIAASEN